MDGQACPGCGNAPCTCGAPAADDTAAPAAPATDDAAAPAEGGDAAPEAEAPAAE